MASGAPPAQAIRVVAAELLANDAFAFADRDLALRALLGMVNHTALWLRPRGRLSAEQVADGYVDLLLGSST